MAFTHPIKRAFDRLLNVPGQTLFLGFALGAFGRQLGFKARFTASPSEVHAISDRKDTRAPVAQEMLRLNGIKVIFTQPDDRAAYLKAMLQRRLGKTMQHTVAEQVAADVLKIGHRACPGRALSMAAIERILLTLFGSESPVNIALPAGMPKPKRNALLMAQDSRVLVSLATPANS